MSVRYPWLPEIAAAPLRRARNSIALRIDRKAPPRAEFDAVAEELKTAKAELAAKRQQYVALTNLIMDGARACRNDPVADAAFKWIKNNEYVLSGDTAWGKKTEQTYQKLIEAVDKASSRDFAK